MRPGAGARQQDDRKDEDQRQSEKYIAHRTQLYVSKQPTGAQTLTGAQLPHGVEILLAVGLERHQSARVGHPGQAVQPPGDDIGQVLDAADPDNSDDVGLASDGVRLGHSFYRGDLFGQLGHAGRFRIDEDKGCQHAPNRTAEA